MFADQPFLASVLLGVGLPDEGSRVDAQNVREASQRSQCEILATALDASDVVRFGSQDFSELRLR